MTYRHRKLPPLRPPTDGDDRTSPPFETEHSSQSPSLFPGSGSRQESLPTSSKIFNQMHNDTVPDMWAYRGCLGPEFDEPSANLLARQKRERQEYEEKRQLEFSNEGLGLKPPPFLEPPSSKAQMRARAFTRESTHYDGGASADATPDENTVSLPRAQTLPRESTYFNGDASADGTPNGNTERLPSLNPSYRYCGFETWVSEPATTSRRPQSEPLPAASLEQRSQVTTAMETSNPSSIVAVTSSNEASQRSSPGDLSGHAAQPTPLTAEQAYHAYSKRHDSFGQSSEGQASNSSSKDAPLHAPTAQNSIPALRSSNHASEGLSEDLSGYPPKMREFLRTSVRGVDQATEYLSTADRYQIYEERAYANKTGSRVVVSELRSRHTANIEAVKMFMHRFWRQVMEENHEYRVDLGEYGLIKMDIALEDADDGLVSACVGVCKRTVGADGLR